MGGNMRRYFLYGLAVGLLVLGVREAFGFILTVAIGAGSDTQLLAVTGAPAAIGISMGILSIRWAGGSPKREGVGTIVVWLLGLLAGLAVIAAIIFLMILSFAAGTQ
jgi:hypothetical protein